MEHFFLHVPTAACYLFNNYQSSHWVKPVILLTFVKCITLQTVELVQKHHARTISVYYMACSVSGQDEPNPELWLVTQAGKMALSCPLGITRDFPQENSVLYPYNKSFIDQACSVKIAGYWPRSFFACLWTSAPSRSINTQKKKNSANIQPSQWPHACFVNNPYLLPGNSRKWSIKK